MNLFVYLLVGFGAWVSLLVIGLAMCRAAARADEASERTEARSEKLVLIT